VPDDLIRTLAGAAAAQQGAQHSSVHHVSAHFFSFGGLGATARWTRAVADGRIALEGAAGFRVMAPGE
jgi:methylenetetrahydrofolate reductase (NADPH)